MAEIAEIPARTEDFLNAEADRNLQTMDEGLSLMNRLSLAAIGFLLVTRDGVVINSEENITRSVQVKKRIDEIWNERYTPRVDTVIGSLPRQERFFKRTYESVGETVVYRSEDRKTFTQFRRDERRVLIDVGNTSKELVKSDVSNAVSAEQLFSDFSEQVEQHIIGNTEKPGRSLKQQADVLTQDLTMGYYTAIGNQKGDDVGLTLSLYFGDVIVDSRPFCVARVGRTFTEAQIKGWRNLSWQGKRGDPVIYRGGWNCRHSYVRIKPEWVTDGLIETKST